MNTTEFPYGSRVCFVAISFASPFFNYIIWKRNIDHKRVHVSELTEDEALDFQRKSRANGQSLNPGEYFIWNKCCEREGIIVESQEPISNHPELFPPEDLTLGFVH